MGIFNNQIFVPALNCNTFSLVSLSQDHCFLDCDFDRSGMRFTFFLILLMQLTLKSKAFKNIKFFCLLFFLTAAANASIATWVYNILISLSGDVQLNPGPKNRCDINFSICYWNLNSIAAHNFDEVFHLKAYIAVYKFGIVYISEAYTDFL